MRIRTRAPAPGTLPPSQVAGADHGPLAAERMTGGTLSFSGPRGVIEARVMVTDRMTPLVVDGRTVHQIGMPYHWGLNGYSRGDSMNELSSQQASGYLELREKP